MNTGELIKKFIELRDFKEARTKAFEAEMAPYTKAMDTIANTVGQQITELGGESIKTEFGTAYHSEILSVKVANREEFMRFVFDDQREEFLTSAVSKEAVKDWIDKYQALPPGIDVTKILKTNFRRS